MRTRSGLELQHNINDNILLDRPPHSRLIT